MSQMTTERGKVLPFHQTPKVNPAAFADTTFQAFAEKISDDYTYILKTAVVPGLPGLGTLKLREVRILATLHFFEKALTPAQISDMLRYDPATVTRAVHMLVGKGKLTRSDNLRDTRSVLLELTPEGTALAEVFRKRLLVVFATLEEQIHVQLSEEEKTEFLHTMLKISKRSKDMKTICSRMTWNFDDTP